MKLWLAAGLAVTLVGAGCAAERLLPPAAQAPLPSAPDAPAPLSAPGAPAASASEVVLPVAGYAPRRTLKQHGEYIEDRFTGYHVGDDIEYADTSAEVPVVAMAGGTVRTVDRVPGYGGFVAIVHTVGSEPVTALYGHLDLGSTTLRVGDAVVRGQFIANLGGHQSSETDGERKHLHFALYPGDELRLNGYERTPEGVARWLNPTDFFTRHGASVTAPARSYDPVADRGGGAFRLRFVIPAGWEVEYVPQVQALNLFTLAGEGTARERSQVFIRYFDATMFLTLPTVTIHTAEEVTVGQGSYAARRYDIEKKPGVGEFTYQPPWRNARHSVTDFAAGVGYSRYYVVAKNPGLDEATYQAVLASMQVVD